MQHAVTPQGRRIAFHRLPGRGPGVVFLGGFRSDMTGTKALFLEDWARARGRAFLRFDYSGHGASGGAFADSCIGDWAADAAAVIAACTEGPQVLVGSSMGGWIALLLARDGRAPVAGLVGIAAAPDFTERLWDGLTEAERDTMRETGRLERPSDYGAPYVFTRRLIEDGEDHLILTRRLSLPFPVRLLQGEADRDVSPSVALSLFAHAQGPDIRVTLVKGADHRFSSPACLALIAQTLEEME
jgi:pimeloyl-ACP methyl ester carboxylesterase